MLSTKPKPNRCKHCRERMPAELARHVLHEDCINPWLAAQADRKEAARLKKERAEDRVKRAAMKTIAQLIAAAQLAFNAYIRERDKDKGCFVCGRPFLDAPGRVQHAGHVRSRGAAGHLRFNEDNCMGECEGCNGPRGAKPHQIKAGAIARMGADRFDALEASNDPHKWVRDELIGIRKTYQNKLKALRREGDKA